MPPSATLPGFDGDSVERTRAYLASQGRDTELAFAGAIHALDGLCRVRTGRGLARQRGHRILDVLRWVESLPYPLPMLVRYGLAPLKGAHFDAPTVRAALGLDAPPAPARVARVERDRVRAQQVFDGDSLDGLDTLEADVVVVGSGAGGAVVAFELARRGLTVVMLEAGRYFDRGDFTHKRPVERTAEMYHPLARTTALGNAMIPIPVGRTVGGTTTINSGTCFRTPDAVLDRWARELGLRDLGPDGLAPFFERVEERLGVAPNAPRWLGATARVVARGADALGMAHGPLPRNAPDCDAQGECVFGCPTDAKRSTNVSYIPAALKAGALLVTGAQVERVLLRGDTAVGVVARVRRAAGKPVDLTVRARRVVVSAGTLWTPLLLARSGVRDPRGHLGRHLTIHPATHCHARFEEVIDPARSVPQGYGVHELAPEGIYFEGATLPPSITGLSLELMGPKLMEVMESYPHLAAFGFMVKDAGEGAVRPGPGGRPLITYRLRRADVQRLRRGMRVLVALFQAAGAREVYPPVRGHTVVATREDARRLATALPPAHAFGLTAYHPLGTARLAADDARGAVSPTHEVFGTHHLHVVDGSSVPSSLGVNPQVTIMALATRAAELLADGL